MTKSPKEDVKKRLPVCNGRNVSLPVEAQRGCWPLYVRYLYRGQLPALEPDQFTSVPLGPMPSGGARLLVIPIRAHSYGGTQRKIRQHQTLKSISFLYGSLGSHGFLDTCFLLHVHLVFVFSCRSQTNFPIFCMPISPLVYRPPQLVLEPSIPHQQLIA